MNFVRPEPVEYHETFARSIQEVPEGDVLEILVASIEDTSEMLDRLGEEKAGYRYGPDKWSVKQVIGHLVDSERIMSYRALRFARGDKTALPSYDENAFVERANFDGQLISALAEELRAVRTASLALFRSFDEEMFLKGGTASGFDFSVRALVYQIAGHEIHHKKILRERYL